MENEFISPNGQNAAPAALKPRRPSNIWLIIVAGLFIIVPFLAWYFTWFGRDLSEADIVSYLAEEKNPRHIQHALSQLEQRIERGDPTVKKFYPQIVATTKSQTAEVRKTAAWVMGQDNKSEEFHGALLALLNDSEPLVRRNAALQLVRFGDASGRTEFRAMLQPFDLKAPFTGTVISLLTYGSNIRSGGLLARIRDTSGNVHEFRSPLDGMISTLRNVKEGEAVNEAQTLVWLIPDRTTILDALRALAYVGTKEDLPVIEAVNRIDASSETISQVSQTAKAIRAR